LFALRISPSFKPYTHYYTYFILLIKHSKSSVSLQSQNRAELQHCIRETAEAMAQMRSYSLQNHNILEMGHNIECLLSKPEMVIGATRP
jgi:hypothetical protein